MTEDSNTAKRIRDFMNRPDFPLMTVAAQKIMLSEFQEYIDVILREHGELRMFVQHFGSGEYKNPANAAKIILSSIPDRSVPPKA